MNNSFDYPEQPKGPSRKKLSPDTLWNVLTGAMLVGTLCVAGYFAYLLANPFSPLNPLPAPTPLPTPIPPTWTPLALDATWTPTITVEPTITSTPRPTFTTEPSATLYKLVIPTSANQATPTKTAKPTGVPYKADIVYYDRISWGSKTNCDVMLVVGTVLNSDNNPYQGATIKLGGLVPGKVFNPPETTLAGIAPAYGPSGFEFNLGVEPVASSKALWVQLYDPGSAPLSNQIFITTYKDCKKNLIFIRFQQN